MEGIDFWVNFVAENSIKEIAKKLGLEGKKPSVELWMCSHCRI